MEAKLDNQRQNEKEKGQCSIQQEQHKPEKDEGKTKKKKINTTEEWNWEDKEKSMTKKECTLEAEVLVYLDHGSTPFDVFQMDTGTNEIILTETNRSPTQVGRNFETTDTDTKAFLGINFIMGINKSPSLEDCWST